MAAVCKELKAHNAYIAPELLKQLAGSIDTSVYYQIEVIRDVEQAAKRLRLEDCLNAHSWAGDEGTKEEAQVVFGQVTFGENYSYEYSNNGNSDGVNEYETDAEFDINKPFCVFIETHDWRNWERDGCNYDREFTTIVIYTPESITDEAQYEIEKNAELKKACNLRPASAL